MKLFQLTIPNEQHGKVVSTLQDELKLDNVTSVEARTSSIVTFRVEDEEMQAILNKLQSMDAGVQFGFCDVMSLTPGTTISKRKTKKNKHRVEYEDGDHEWLCFHLEGTRLQLFNGYCWCMVAVFEPSLRTLRATMFLTLRFQRYDQQYLCWRSGVLKAYSETNDHFPVSYDHTAAIGGVSADEWVDVFRNENFFQVQDAITMDWYSLSGYVFGHARGRPLNMMSMAGGKAAEASYYGVEDYLSYVEEVVASEPQMEETGDPSTEAASAQGGGGEPSDDQLVEESKDEVDGRDGGDGDADDEEESDDDEEGDDEEEEEEGESEDDGDGEDQ